MPPKLISADDHMDMCYVPPTLFTDRVPKRWKELAPRVERLPQGPMWVREGKPWGVAGSKRADGRKVVFDMVGLPEEPEPGVWRPASPKYRLQDMDRDGVYAQVIYGFLNWTFSDGELKSESIKAYNSWLAEELCSADRERLLGLAYLPSHDAEAAVGELHRVLTLGLRGAVFDMFDSARPIFDRAWEPLWSAGEETGAALSVHIGGGTHTLPRGSVGGTWMHPARAAITCMQLDEALVSFVFSGILERHPRLQVVLGESSIGWIPFVLERLDFEQSNYTGLVAEMPKERASDLFRRNMYATFQEDALGVKLIPHIGEDNVMWASDYPHADGTFPNTVKALDHIFAGASEQVRRKATMDNAKALYRVR